MASQAPEEIDKADSKNPTEISTDGNRSLMDAEQHSIPLVRIPRLDDICLHTIASNFHEFPVIDQLPPEYIEQLVVLLDSALQIPSKTREFGIVSTSTRKASTRLEPAQPHRLPFDVAARYVKNERYWEKITRSRWPLLVDIAQYGNSWKRTYSERYVQELLEQYVHLPNASETFLQTASSEILNRQLSAARPFVHVLVLSQLPSHIDISKCLIDFTLLHTVKLTYGAEDVGMDYDRSLFGMRPSDAIGIAKFLAYSSTILHLSLIQNNIDCKLLSYLLEGLARNCTLQTLNLAHNHIGDNGTADLVHWLVSGSHMLVKLNLENNGITAIGISSLTSALRSNICLSYLNLSLNEFGDAGGATLFRGISEDCSLTALFLTACGMRDAAGDALISLLECTPELRLSTLSIASNKAMFDNSARSSSLLSALAQNKSLIDFDVRLSVNADILALVKSVMSERSAVHQQRKRKALQASGFDNAL